MLYSLILLICFHSFFTFFDNLTKEEACWIEQRLILAYHSNDPLYGYNITSGGEHHDVSSATRAKISKANSDTNNGMYGKHHTEVSRKKISEANYRRDYSKTKFRLDLLQQGKQNYIERNGGHSWNYGKHVSEEEKKLMSERQKKWIAEHGHPLAGMKYEGERLQKILDSQRMAVESVKRPVFQYSKSGELIAEFSSVTEAESLTGIHSISKVCRTYERGYGRNKTAGGFIWKYKCIYA